MNAYRKYCAHVALLAALASLLGSCDFTDQGSASSRSLMKADKPSIDTSLVLEKFDLYRSTRFESIEDAISSGTEDVYKLVLWGQKLGKIPAAIGQLKNLQTLDIAYNDLAELPEAMADLHYLQGLYANGNNLTEFPEEIILLPVLERVDLSENLITEIPRAVIRMDQLTRLSLDKNAISVIPPEVYSLGNLSVLELADNSISELSGDIKNLVHLKKLDLANNQLAKIPEEILSLSGTLEDLRLQGNQIPRAELEALAEAMPGTSVRY